MFEGIIYELDGLMVDTELLHVQAWNEYLDRFDKQASENEILDLLGRRTYDIAEYIRQRFALPEDPLTIFEKRQEIFMRLVEENLEPRPGLFETLQMFKDYEFKLAVISTGPRDYVYYMLETLGLDEAFDVIVAGDMVKFGYPDPTFLVACGETFALHPSYCLLLTCRRDGIEAATNTGMKSICIPGYNTPRWRAIGSALVLNSLSELTLNHIRSLWTDPNDDFRPQPQLFPHRQRY
jgi:beta-phosphoglucomutase-like phosphatase (HAD superfamily)